jgi:UDP-N-acetylmuramate dehydrogenase
MIHAGPVEEHVMPQGVEHAGLEDFGEIVKAHEPLAPYTYLKVGGPADALVQPRTTEELAALVRRCGQQSIPLHVLGGGGNILVPDEGVQGVVLRLSEAPFQEVHVDNQRIRAGTGASLSALISHSARRALAGLERLVGIQGTVGGALCCNAGDRSAEIGQFVQRVEVLDDQGEIQTRERDELRFFPGGSNLDDPVILAAEFELEADLPEAIVKRMRKAWIQRKATQPLTFQAHARMFKDPRGFSAAALIEQAGLAKTRVGGAEISERNANAVVVHPGGTARDVLRLMDLVRSRVQERFHVELEFELTIW